MLDFICYFCKFKNNLLFKEKIINKTAKIVTEANVPCALLAKIYVTNSLVVLNALIIRIKRMNLRIRPNLKKFIIGILDINSIQPQRMNSNLLSD